MIKHPAALGEYPRVDSTAKVACWIRRDISSERLVKVSVRFGKRQCFVGALVLGDEVLLGAVPMEDMDLVLNPARQEVTVNPASPNIPNSRVKKAA